MEKQTFKRFNWVIKDFASLQHDRYCSFPVLIGDINWRIVAYPGDGYNAGYMSLFLEALEPLPCGWRRYVEYRFTIVNHCQPHSFDKRARNWFDKKARSWGYVNAIPVINLIDLNSGYLLNGELMIMVEVEVLDYVDTLPASQVEEISDGGEHRAHDYSSSSEDLQNKDDLTIDVNGFQVLGSQVNQVKAIFEKHPELTSDFKLKNQELKNAYMGVLLDLIKTLSKSTKELTVKDLKKAYKTLSDLVKSGLDLDWLRHKLDQALEKQIAYDARITDLEKNVKNRKLALAELEADLDKEKAAASASLMLFD